MTTSDARYQRGLALLDRLNPTAATQIKLELDCIAPDCSRYIIEHVVGDLYSRPGLDLKSREIAAIAALTTLGGSTAHQLQAHIGGALAAGCSREEIVEVMLQMSAFAGFPATLNALQNAKPLLITDSDPQLTEQENTPCGHES